MLDNILRPMVNKTPIEFNIRKTAQAINFFARKHASCSIDKLKVIKLVWLADRYHIRKYGRPITGDTYFAMDYGPVGSGVKDITSLNNCLSGVEQKYAKKYLSLSNKTTVKSVREVQESVFSRTDLEALNFAFDNFGDKKPSQLVTLSHKYPEWNKFEAELEAKIITRASMSYDDFFLNPSSVVDDKFKEDQAQLDVNREILQEYAAMSHALT